VDVLSKDKIWEIETPEVGNWSDSMDVGNVSSHPFKGDLDAMLNNQSFQKMVHGLRWVFK
jgi:hypothetical protein